jgi:hypothetical protein
MNKYRSWLSCLLGFQLLLIFGIFFISQGMKSEFKPQVFVNIPVSTLDKLTVSSSNGVVELESKGGVWSLPQLHQLKVDSEKIVSALDKLMSLKTSWPVTTTASAHKRFEVSDNQYQRKIELYTSGRLAETVYIGSSPSFRKSHVRINGDDNVYALEISSFDFSDKPEDWLDQSLLHVDAIESIQGKDYQLNKNEDQWSLQELSGNNTTLKAVNTEKIETLYTLISRLNITGVVSEKEIPDFTSAQVVDVTVSAGESLSYQFLTLNGSYYVKRNDVDALFTLAKDDYEKVAEANLSQLMEAEKTQQ